jgi:hypothetical protein
MVAFGDGGRPLDFQKSLRRRKFTNGKVRHYQCPPQLNIYSFPAHRDEIALISQGD